MVAKAKKASAKSAPPVGKTVRDVGSTDAQTATTPVVVQGRPLRAPAKTTGPTTPEGKARVVDSTASEKDKEGLTSTLVKATKVGYYGHKRRRIGEVFQMLLGKGDLPSWVVALEDAEPGQDEGTRGLHSGGREDDRIREERAERTDGKGFKKAVGKGSDKIVDPTIVNDALPLSEGGNERKPEGGNDHVI